MNKNYEFFIVRSEGGLGAQIIAASAYYFLKSIGCRVLMDLGYFEYPYREAKMGTSQVTHWDWKLDFYGINKSNLDWINLNKLRNYTKGNKKDSAEGIEIFDFAYALKNFKEVEGKEFNDFNINNDNTCNLKNM